jgi:hypothetical protein
MTDPTFANEQDDERAAEREAPGKKYRFSCVFPSQPCHVIILTLPFGIWQYNRLWIALISLHDNHAH